MRKKRQAGNQSFLAADAGNSRVAFGLFYAGGFLGSVSVDNRDLAKENTASAVSSEIIAMNGGSRAAGCLVSSVAPRVNVHVSGICGDVCRGSPVYLSPMADAGVDFIYDDVSKLGTDRVAAAAACRRIFPGEDVVIVDAGTAVTFGFLNRAGVFRGGPIMPGPGISAECLADSAELLPRIELRAPANIMAANTVDGIRSGIFWGFIKAVEGIIGEMKKGPAKGARVAAAGGWSSFLCEYSGMIDSHEPLLVLKGLNVIYGRLRL